MTDEFDKKRKDRDESGKFVKGHKVPSPRLGRPKRGDTMPVLIAVSQEAYSAEDLVRMVRDTYNMARDKEDWKGMFTVIQFVVNYAVGKPVQRTLSATINPDEIRAILGGLTGDEKGDTPAADDDVVDVTPE